jgi:hypothetical protein
VDRDLQRYLGNQVRTARAILFTGAGFSLGAEDREGRRLPTARQLTEALWSVAFPDELYDGSALGDVFDASVLQSRNGTEALLRERLTVDPERLPPDYQIWFSFPWYRIYTLNFDTLAEAANRAFDLPRELVPVSGLSDPLPTSGGGLCVVHLNGRLEDFPNLTFSQRQYGERQSAPDLWYANLVRELHSRPVVFVGTSLDEPPLWQYVEARGRRRPGRELRPRSFLVAPELPLARRAALGQYNVVWEQATAGSFAADVLSALAGDAEAGIRSLRQQVLTESGGDTLLPVHDVLEDSVGDEREFLLGREPRWSDVTQGYAVTRDFDDRLPSRVRDAQARLLVITGTAGSGKSTSAMRFLLSQVADGRRSYVLNDNATSRIQQIRAAVRVSDAETLLVDDADRFGQALAGLLHDLVTDNPGLLVVAALRSARFEHLRLSEALSATPRVVEETAPDLEDSDIELLLDALDRAQRLGNLRGKSRAEQRRLFETQFGRQLLVAMIEVTSDERFGEKVESECRQLVGTSSAIYAVTTVATQFRGALSDHEILTAVGGDPADVMSALDGLLRRHLLVRGRGGAIGLRHRVIADRALGYYRTTGGLAEPLAGLVFSVAATVRPGDLNASRQGRLLIRLINHGMLISLLREPATGAADLVAIRHIYEGIEDIFGNDHHYWLQRGSFETEEGNLDLAKNFLDQARGMEPDDTLVRTQWAYMTLKRASRRAMDPGAAEAAAAAFTELEDVIENRGRRDPYPFHVYGSQGLAWLNRSPIPHGDKVAGMERLRDVVARGISLHPRRQDLRQLARDLDQAYLMLATDGQDPAQAVP